MTPETIYDTLNESDDFSGHERLLREHLISQVKRYDEGQDDPQDIAYELAGLMSARSMYRLPQDNPYMEILGLAGELELPQFHRSATASWEELKRLVAALPE